MLKLSYIDDTDDAIEEHVNLFTGKNLHEVWPDRKRKIVAQSSESHFSLTLLKIPPSQ